MLVQLGWYILTAVAHKAMQRRPQGQEESLVTTKDNLKLNDNTKQNLTVTEWNKHQRQYNYIL